TAGEDDTTGNDFLNFKLFSVSGHKYTDVNGNDATAGVGLDDTGLGGVTIFLDANSNGTLNWTDNPSKPNVGGWDPGEGERWTTTANDGSYSFTGLDASYAGDKVLEVLPNG